MIVVRQDAERTLEDRARQRDDFGTRADIVSTDHPEVAQEYRAAHDI